MEESWKKKQKVVGGKKNASGSWRCQQSPLSSPLNRFKFKAHISSLTHRLAVINVLWIWGHFISLSGARKILTCGWVFSHHLLEMQRQDERWIISIIHCYCSLLDMTAAFILNVELLRVFEIGSVARFPPGAKQPSGTVTSLAAESCCSSPSWKRSLEAKRINCGSMVCKDLKYPLTGTLLMCFLLFVFVALVGDS